MREITLGELMVRVGVDIGGLESGLKEAEKMTKGFGKSFEKIGKGMVTTGKSLTRYVTTPILGIGAGAIKVGIDFEKGMSEVQAISGATGTQLERLADIAKEMGSTTKFSATQATEGLKFMALAGWDVDEMVTALPSVLALAAAANMDLAQASDIVTDTMSAFSMEAERAGEAADIFATTQASSNTTVVQLGEAMKYAGAAANAAGMDLASTAAILGVLADAGIKGSMAGTTFNAMLRDLRKNSADGTIVIEEMGKAYEDLTKIHLYEANGEMRNMIDIVQDLETATQGMTTQQRDFAMSALFGEQSLKGMNIMLATGSEHLIDLSDQITNANGSAQEMAEVMQDNLGGSLTTLKSSLEGVGIQLSEIMLPTLEKVVAGAKGWVDSFAGMDTATQELIIQIGLFMAAAGPALTILGKFVGLLSNPIGFGLVAGIAGAGGVIWALQELGIEAGAGKRAIENLFEKLETGFKGITGGFDGVGEEFKNVTRPIREAVGETETLTERWARIAFEPKDANVNIEPPDERVIGTTEELMGRWKAILFDRKEAGVDLSPPNQESIGVTETLMERWQRIFFDRKEAGVKLEPPDERVIGTTETLMERWKRIFFDEKEAGVDLEAPDEGVVVRTETLMERWKNIFFGSKDAKVDLEAPDEGVIGTTETLRERWARIIFEPKDAKVDLGIPDRAIIGEAAGLAEQWNALHVGSHSATMEMTTIYTTVHKEVHEVFEGAGGITPEPFSKGINYVPYDMIAKVHKGEKIIPASEVKQRDGVVQNITINSPKPLSAFEVARQLKRLDRELAMGV